MLNACSVFTSRKVLERLAYVIYLIIGGIMGIMRKKCNQNNTNFVILFEITNVELTTTGIVIAYLLMTLTEQF